MPEIVPALRSALLTPMRNGDRTVIWTQPDWASRTCCTSGWSPPPGARPVRTSSSGTPVMDPWLPALPRLRRADRRGVARPLPGPARPRLPPGLRHRLHPRGPRDLRARLPARQPAARENSLDSDADDVRSNVRRGDYYSAPRFRGLYSFDIAEYVRVALAKSIERGRGRRPTIRVVSDDPAWCRLKLVPGGPADVEYAAGGQPARALPHARRRASLVLANSTFSYWGAYVGNVVHGDNHAQVWAPWFTAATSRAARPGTSTPAGRWCATSRAGGTDESSPSVAPRPWAAAAGPAGRRYVVPLEAKEHRPPPAACDCPRCRDPAGDRVRCGRSAWSRTKPTSSRATSSTWSRRESTRYLVADNGSTDGTLDLLNDLARHHPCTSRSTPAGATSKQRR